MAIKINTDVERPSDEVVEGFRKLLEEYHEITPGISDVSNRLNAMHSDIKPLFEGIRVVGVALTIRTMPSDNTAVLRVLEVVQKDDMIVVDTNKSNSLGFWGGTICHEVQQVGAAGIVLDGAIRDVAELRRLRFPVLCTGIVPNAPGKGGFGTINYPIQCGGVVVHPGDIVIIDENGVVVVPRDEAEDVLQKTTRFLDNEARMIALVKAGGSIRDIFGLAKVETVDNVMLYERMRQAGTI